MTMRENLIKCAKSLIKDRQEDSGELSVDFMEGFNEGLATFISVIIKEPVGDLMEEIGAWSQ
jgi:hypothetical protein